MKWADQKIQNEELRQSARRECFIQNIQVTFSILLCGFCRPLSFTFAAAQKGDHLCFSFKFMWPSVNQLGKGSHMSCAPALTAPSPFRLSGRSAALGEVPVTTVHWVYKSCEIGLFGYLCW